MRWALVVAGALVISGSGVSCKDKGKPARPASQDKDGGAASTPDGVEIAVLQSVAVRHAQTGLPMPPDDQLADAASQVLADSPALIMASEEVAEGRVAVPARLRITVTCDEVTAAASHSLICAAEAELDLEGSSRLEPHANVLIERVLSGPEQTVDDGAVADAATAAVLEATGTVAAHEQLRQSDDAAVLAALTDTDVDVRIWALQLAAERELEQAFDHAAEALGSKDPGLSGAGVRALVAIGDERAIDLLAARADFSDPDRLRVLVEAVTAIGGEEAIEFLELVATGHSEAALRQQAEEGIERVRRRMKR